jgi:Asp-tRNA(Asn)/Glu-tRNA(Gln) amidotransferase A subunit family amidase
MVNGREASAREVADAALAVLEQVDGSLRAFREVWPDRAARVADAVDRALAAGGELPLAGVPIGVKAWDGLRSAQARRLVAAGCVPVGATSVPLPTTGWQTWGHTGRGPTVNPWRPDRVPGGSSAGSAAAVAAGVVPLATGTDGAGSIRVPAAWCGIVGVKPTAGWMPGSRPGDLRVPGPLARTVADAAAYLAVVTGQADLATIIGASAAGASDGRASTPPRAAWSTTLGFADVDPEYVATARSVAARLADAGAVDLLDAEPRLLDPTSAWPVLRAATATGADRAETGADQTETGAHPAGAPDRSGPWSTGQPTAGPDGDRRAARALRAENDSRLAALFEGVDVLLTPTTPAGPHGHHGPGDGLNVSLTWAFNLSGHPAISVPAGCAPDGLPVGLQLVGRHHEERLLLRLAAEVERLAPRPVPPPGRSVATDRAPAPAGRPRSEIGGSRHAG